MSMSKEEFRNKILKAQRLRHAFAEKGYIKTKPKSEKKSCNLNFLLVNY